MSLPKADYAALADNHLTCREFRHSWQQEGAYRVQWAYEEGKKKKSRILARTARCTRCGTTREDKFTQSWDKKSASYTYVEDYQFKGVDRGNVNHEVHSEFFRRSTERHGVEGETNA